MHYQKKKTDREYITEFCEVLGLEETKASMTKFKYNKDWKCIMTKEYKLIEFEEGKTELYNLQNDREERYNIAEEYPEIVDQMKKRYPMSPIKR